MRLYRPIHAAALTLLLCPLALTQQTPDSTTYNRRVLPEDIEFTDAGGGLIDVHIATRVSSQEPTPVNLSLEALIEVNGVAIGLVPGSILYSHNTNGCNAGQCTNNCVGECLSYAQYGGTGCGCEVIVIIDTHLTQLAAGDSVSVTLFPAPGSLAESYTADDIVTVTYDPSLCISYCNPANPNSTGLPGQIAATGSSSVLVNDLTLTASQLPPNQFGMFINSMSQGMVQPPNSSGLLCVSGQIGRHSTQIKNSGTDGQFSIPVDLTALPRPSGGPYSVQPGEAWNFQAWHRDIGNDSNFTNACTVVFAP